MTDKITLEEVEAGIRHICVEMAARLEVARKKYDAEIAALQARVAEHPEIETEAMMRIGAQVRMMMQSFKDKETTDDPA
ncbi:hypothetical protein OEG84_11570 [Hoeflea sp. G2-23]|uniref:Uncharacterized protein n=1 Tax=Hoeflea algicola TaxID=2983763 RepID=A0ABT3Z978_9HYPH|nr:hypothetical protein [Hoeflea algicola]MCY0148332.1 hypothetical protein [Hoeflea algicola]